MRPACQPPPIRDRKLNHDTLAMASVFQQTARTRLAAGSSLDDLAPRARSRELDPGKTLDSARERGCCSNLKRASLAITEPFHSAGVASGPRENRIRRGWTRAQCHRVRPSPSVCGAWAPKGPPLQHFGLPPHPPGAAPRMRRERPRAELDAVGQCRRAPLAHPPRVSPPRSGKRTQIDLLQYTLWISILLPG